ncbi:uncharacterized mitochondrial protein AtMg00820-like [Capsicum annuum]|uniref:uncharacterized mitochondrial protein AtMg00820-like n=1 Tax=Capsicum annuum TaxID=4072 RepID=UPI001FB0E015|nr:uncharacterized mitochondrial protein AtMg00820-like [Capsicum annuum]
MKEEIDALQENQTWELMPKPRDLKPISCKWVYKVKCRTDGSVERNKARLVARGFSQKYELDYDETFSPVAKFTTLCALLALAASKDWKLGHRELDRDIYMTQPCHTYCGLNYTIQQVSAQTYTKTVTNVGEANSIYIVQVIEVAGVALSVKPRSRPIK